MDDPVADRLDRGARLPTHRCQSIAAHGDPPAPATPPPAPAAPWPPTNDLSPAINRVPEEDSGSAAAPDPGGGVVLHPLVLVPGLTCSELEVRLTDAYRPTLPHCGAMKGKGWFGLWANCSELPAHHYVPCFMEQMSLVYDPAAGDYRNLPGVETRVRNFGSSRGFQRKHTYGS
ncbi:lecithin-cholesterol acyltransferase-like 1 [Panicum virgatum]|uniref:lecithin-cholesterol acyltransferase-like 1 n=1 Tax=Panicum virgatum TaxID=38727 RepID=UPI0019D62178|nr:lecithin-cholesterol acyltransferase-like 1 [Panicum virgatum]